MKNLIKIGLVALLISNCQGKSFEIPTGEELFFKSIEIKQGSLNEWDQFDGPDISLKIGGENKTFHFEIRENISNFPAKWILPDDLTDSTDVPATNAKWFLLLEDIDSTSANEEMLHLTFNPFLKLEQTNRSPVFLYKDEWEIAIDFVTH